MSCTERSKPKKKRAHCLLTWALCLCILLLGYPDLSGRVFVFAQRKPELGRGELFTRNKTPYFLAKGKGFDVVLTMYSYYNKYKKMLMMTNHTKTEEVYR